MMTLCFVVFLSSLISIVTHIPVFSFHKFEKNSLTDCSKKNFFIPLNLAHFSLIIMSFIFIPVLIPKFFSMFYLKINQLRR
jgi:hypothetical protein